MTQSTLTVPGLVSDNLCSYFGISAFSALPLAKRYDCGCCPFGVWPNKTPGKIELEEPNQNKIPIGG